MVHSGCKEKLQFPGCCPNFIAPSLFFSSSTACFLSRWSKQNSTTAELKLSSVTSSLNICSSMLLWWQLKNDKLGILVKSVCIWFCTFSTVRCKSIIPHREETKFSDFLNYSHYWKAVLCCMWMVSSLTGAPFSPFGPGSPGEPGDPCAKEEYTIK